MFSENLEEEKEEGDEMSLAKLLNEKKQAADDAKLLANRIALLKQEELRTWKKIEEIKRKSYEIYQLKKKNEDR
jgi:ferredoxin-fold anticodon binding domain-containing protein